MRLGAFLCPGGHHVAAWRQPGRFFEPDRLRLLLPRGRALFDLRLAQDPAPAVGASGGWCRPARRRPKALAARTAEVIFTVQQTLDDAVAFYADVKSRMSRHNLDPGHLKIMPCALPVVGRSEAEAPDKFAVLRELIHPVVGPSLLEQLTGADLSAYTDDAPVPELPETNGGKGRQELFLRVARR
jgi:alkanesulfonate monooxygenase SsuD/methylene tetrahydromethanopterin reductase-like flavin-dependent oxidoreductase (luciferase family)